MSNEQKNAENVFKEFKEHSVTEFFRKNRQMLGYSGKVRSLTTAIHEYVTNSLDACEEAGIMPEIYLKIQQNGEERYIITVRDNAIGIPKKIIGKALASVLSGTKFHRYVQQRGQQGIGAAGCTLFAQITTGKGIHAKSYTDSEAFECDISLDIKNNKPIIENVAKLENPTNMHGLEVTAEFAGVKYEKSVHGVYEYVKRTAMVNPHASLTLLDPEGKEYVFPRSVEELPKKAKQAKPHPLGLEAADLLDFAHASTSNKVSTFFSESFSRFGPAKIDEMKTLIPELDFDKEPRNITWNESEAIVNAIKKMKWVSPETDSISEIGDAGIEAAIRNILNPEFVSVVQRKPKVFKGGIPFLVEIGIAYGGAAGRSGEESASMSILRFANKVPLLFDGGSCAITEAVRDIAWKRYGINDIDNVPVSILVSICSVYVPYAGVGKQSVAPESEIEDEIKLAVMDGLRNLQRYLHGMKNKGIAETRYKTIMRYIGQLSEDLGELTGKDAVTIENSLRNLIETKYKSLFANSEEEKEEAASDESQEPEEQEN